MTLRIPNVGEGLLLGMALGKTAQENQVLRLFSNNKTPAETDTAASYTELSGNGYVPKTLTGASWTITEGDPTVAAYAQQEFAFTGAAGDVYGYYVTGATSGLLLWAERFDDGPYAVAQAGDAIKVTPRMTMQDTLDEL